MIASPYLIGIIAGVVSAVLFGSMSVPTLLAVWLFLFTPLPILLTGIAWNPRVAQIAMFVAFVCVAALMGPIGALFYSFCFGLPSLLLIHLFLLRREIVLGGSSADQPGVAAVHAFEWYPLGRMIMWTTVIGGAGVAAGIAMIGDEANYLRVTGVIFDETLRTAIRSTLGPNVDQALLDELLISTKRYFVPVLFAMLWLTTMLGSFGAAIKSATISGQLPRPWAPFSRLEYPTVMMPAFFCAIAASFLPGLGAVMAMAFVGAFAFAYMLLGLAVIHHWAADSPFKFIILSTVYLGIFITGVWVVPILVLGGLSEPLLQLRKRGNQHPTPPSDKTGPEN